MYTNILWRQSKSIGRKRLDEEAYFQYLLMHTLLNRAHPKDANGVQNVRNNILLVTEADLASSQKKKMLSPNRCLIM